MRYATDQAGKLLKDLNNHVSAATESPGPEEVHDLRVSIRRFTGVLRALEPCFSKPESKSMRRALKDIMKHAGEVRDRDIALGLLAKVSADPADPLLPEIRAERHDAARNLTSALRAFAATGLSADWRAAQAKVMAFGTPPSVEDMAVKTLLPVIAEFFSRGKKAARDSAPSRVIHRFRIAAKHLRYTLDFFLPLYGDSRKEIAEQLKEIQSLLGDINDAAMARRMLKPHTRIPGSNLRPSGAIGEKPLSALRRRVTKKTAKFRRLYAPLFQSGRTAKHWKAVVSKPLPAVPETKSVRSTGKLRLV
jgi:CHAD domain-containing protein